MIQFSGCAIYDVYEKESNGAIAFPSLEEAGDIPLSSAHTNDPDGDLDPDEVTYYAILFGNRYDHSYSYLYDLSTNHYSPFKKLPFDAIQGKGDIFYYLQDTGLGNKLYSQDVNGEERILIDQDIQGFLVNGKYIYYYSGSNIYRSDLSGKNSVRLATVNNPINKLCIDNGSLFVGDGESITMVNLEDSTQTVVANSPYSDFDVNRSTIYLLNNQIHAVLVQSGVESVLVDELC